MMGENPTGSLEEMAGRLATAELEVRLSGRKTVPSDLIHLTKQVEATKAGIPELQEKEFWWTVPFTVDEPQESEADTFYMENGFYMEADELFFETEGTHLRMFGKETSRGVRDLLDTYSVFSESYILLYLDKKQLRKHVKDPLQVRTIYHGQQSDSVHHRKDVLRRDNAYTTFLRSSYEHNMAEIDQRMAEQLAGCDRRFDTCEIVYNTLVHNAAMTSEEAYYHNRMSQSEYFSDAIWRDYYQSDIRQKAMEERRRRRMQHERKMAEYRRALNASATKTEIRERRLHLMAVGEAVYCQGELMALVVYKKEEPVYEIRCSSQFHMETLTGQIYRNDILFHKKAAKIPLIQHLLQAYGDALPVYQPLDPRPRNCPDDLWRMWAEARWAQTLNLLQSVQ